MKGHIRKRGTTWTFVVDKGKHPITGKRNQKSVGGFPRKKDAEVALRKFLNEVDENRYVEPSKQVFSSYMEYWFSHYQKRIKDTTVSNRKYMMEKHLIKENPFSNKPLSEIKLMHYTI